MGKRKFRSAEVTITNFTKGGNGLGHYSREDGTSASVEVPFTAPGDRVKALLLRKRNSCYSSKLEEIITPAPERIPPRCIHFATCGGCRLQHIDYEYQLRWKETYIRKCFETVISPLVNFLPIIGCSAPWQYRNKMEYSFSQDAAGNKYLGLIADSSKGRVLNLTECHLTHPWFIDTLKSVRRWWENANLAAYHPYRNTGSLRTLTMREGITTGDRMVILTVSGNPEYALHQDQLNALVASIQQVLEPLAAGSQLSIFLRIQQINKGMATQFYEMLLFGSDHIREKLLIDIDPSNPQELLFHISPTAFFQPNSLQAAKLYSTALRLANVNSKSTVYDLYCGTGALGLAIAHRAQQVIGIEISKESALDARTNAKLNNIENVQIFSGDVGHTLQTLPEKGIAPPDVVIVDPPRAGLDAEAIKHLMNLQPSKILYISCNPATQAVNAAEIVQKGYQIHTIQPVDQFPQTAHVENIVVLERS